MSGARLEWQDSEPEFTEDTLIDPYANEPMEDVPPAGEVPVNPRDPITLKHFSNIPPSQITIAPDNFSYHKPSLVHWISIKGTSPMIPDMQITEGQLRPNRTLADAAKFIKFTRKENKELKGQVEELKSQNEELLRENLKLKQNLKVKKEKTSRLLSEFSTFKRKISDIVETEKPLVIKKRKTDGPKVGKS